MNGPLMPSARDKTRRPRPVHRGSIARAGVAQTVAGSAGLVAQPSKAALHGRSHGPLALCSILPEDVLEEVGGASRLFI